MKSNKHMAIRLGGNLASMILVIVGLTQYDKAGGQNLWWLFMMITGYLGNGASAIIERKVPPSNLERDSSSNAGA